MVAATAPTAAAAAPTATKPAPAAAAAAPAANDRKARFLAVFPRIQREMREHLERNHFPADAKDWLERNIAYNVPHGKLNRGMSVVDTVEILRGAPLTDEHEYFEAALLGWGVELLQSFFLVADDIMDTSITRRGQPCWYRVQRPARVGMIAINDGLLLEAAIFHLLKRHFRAKPYYPDLLDLFHDMILATELGQLIDLITAPEDSVDLARFSLAKHRLIVVYKTAYYSFYLPVALAMMYTGVPVPAHMPTLANTISVAMCDAGAAEKKDEKTEEKEESNGHTATTSTNGHAPSKDTPETTPPPPPSSKDTPTEPYQLALDILLPLGEYFQVQDDFLDCFGGAAIGKIGTDIRDNKCSWLVCTALALASPAQRAVLDANYGRREDVVCEARVKDVYEELGMRGRYEAYEERAYVMLGGLIERVQEGGEGTLKKEIFRSFLKKIYRRQK